MGPTFDAAEIATLSRDIIADLSGAAGPAQVLDRLCSIAVERIPGAAWAGISRGRRGVFETVAATGDVVRDVDAAQYALGSGPCVDAMVDDHMFLASDLATDPRWPEFGRAATQRGVHSMLSYRLFLEDDDAIAALNLYSGRVGAFDDVDEVLTVLLATHGAMMVSRAAETIRADNLVVALRSSREIGIAIGIVMTTYRIPRDEAFHILRLFSQRMHRKLADIAVEVADTGAVPDLPGSRPRQDQARRSRTNDTT